MEEIFAQLGGLLAGVFALAQGGFDGVNQVVGLLIAIIAALLMPVWRSLWATAAGATVVHILVGVLRPVLDGAEFVLPELLTVGFWMGAFTLFLGYAIVIAVFFFIKTLVTGSAFRRRHHRHAH